MKRLFQVNGSFFESKQEAKVARGPVTTPAKPAEAGVFGSKPTPAKYAHVISYGPDHWKRGGDVPGAPAPKPAPVKRVRKPKAVAVE
jgi:hypothetical protein